MKKRLSIYIIFFAYSLSVYSQAFDYIIGYYKQQIIGKDSIRLPLIYKGKMEYNFAISKDPIVFDTKEKILTPFKSKEYPISYSVVYQDKLISLFETGSFVCYTIPSMERDIIFEKKINTRKFQNHWIIENKLIGLSKGKYYYLDSNNKWIKYLETIPIKRQSKLFENNSYISFCDCHGEWGGTVYFYDKKSHKIHFTEATCANSIFERDNKYFVLSHLGHFFGSAELKEISHPDLLPTVELKDVNKTVNGQALGYMDKTDGAKKIFDFFAIQFFSSFVYKGRIIYMVYWCETTFLAEIKNNTIEIVNPLFNRELYAHEPITSLYGDVILMNLDFYGIAEEKEFSCILIKDNQLIKIDWNEKH